MSDFEKQEIKQALLKYCELDTLAMVMIYEKVTTKKLDLFEVTSENLRKNIWNFL